MAKGTKTGGRKKGTPNKKTKELLELIEEKHKGFDPILELINIAKDIKTPIDIKVSVLKDLASYIYPKRKASNDDTSIDEVRPIIVTSIEDKELLEGI